MNRRSFVYLTSVVICGVAVIAASVQSVWQSPPGAEWFLLAALTLLTGSFTIKIPSLPALLSVSETFVLTTVLLFGTAAGTLTAVLDALVILLWMDRSRRSVRRVLFNATGPAIAIWVAGHAFFALSGTEPGHIERESVRGLIAAVFVFALAYFLINSWLVAGALATDRTESVVRIWFRNFPAVSINYFVGSSAALLIAAYTDGVDAVAVSIIVPLLLISYLTFRTSMGRLEDANRHISQLNELYLSTIETLAMAVDAKDQITHGHIRRVQIYALELATRLGVNEASQLKAIEAAALLHDMGKLAIPEHILNKPGKLTSTEFDKMKHHVTIGADLLSAIKFPYPVVPIVRHHHENWDGTGYPAGVSGTDIPLGARILSVVDCFDALTSDRPYRPRLSVEAAFEVLRERRGTMYDPLVVDTFIRAYPQIGPTAQEAGQDARSVLPGANLDKAFAERAALQQIRANASETALLADCAASLLRTTTLEDAVDTAAHFLRQLTPASMFAYYSYDAATDRLRCDYAVGDPRQLVSGLVIRLGERITGWCAANRQTAVNSDASLDLAQIANMFSPPLQSALSSPVGPKQLHGVLTGYSTRQNAFDDVHRYAFEHVAHLLNERISMQGRSGGTLVSFPGVKRHPL